jgi:hypothetical protein
MRVYVYIEYTSGQMEELARFHNTYDAQIFVQSYMNEYTSESKKGMRIEAAYEPHIYYKWGGGPVYDTAPPKR